MSGAEDKGKRYVALLEDSRVKGSWAELPEFIRKVTKHAPNEKTLIRIARAEHFVATHTSQRPQTGASEAATNPLQVLKESVDNVQNTLSEETFQGRTCLAWAAWTGAMSGSPASINTSDVVPLFDRYGQKGTSAWTKICLLKAVYFSTCSHVKRGEELQAAAAFKAATAWIGLQLDSINSVPQLTYWAEQLLAQCGTSRISALTQGDKRNALRLWSSLTSKSQEVPAATYGNVGQNIARDKVWNAYYALLSHNLAHSQSDSSTRTEQAAELRKVEVAYENALLRNLKFPKATDSNAEVEDWVEQVIHNWHILCGPAWSETDLGEGGRNGITRNVLDILYRASTKTFHSLLILRRLFQVHKALTEFDLAYRCLDTYMELADRARARAAKAGEASPESDEIVLLTVSEGVEGLCSYGGQPEAQRAFDLTSKLEDWLEQILPVVGSHFANGHTVPDAASNGHNTLSISATAQQDIYRAIGIGKACWARWTPFSESRSELQAEALLALRRAATISEPRLSSLYALALLCAETGDIPQALRWTKIALQRSSQTGQAVARPNASHEQCVFWHLMALLLSSQQDFETALRTSAAALDSLIPSAQTGDKSRDTNNATSSIKSSGSYTVAELECNDLQRLIELQMSNLALIELTDGPDTALSHSSGLLSLYSSLFKKFEVPIVKQPLEQPFTPPKTSAGTIKSGKGSMFSRRKQTPSIAPSGAAASLNSASIADSEARPGTQASQAPAIQVTDESGRSPGRKHHSLLHRHHDHDASSKRLKEIRPGTAKSSKQETDGIHQSQAPSTPGQTRSSVVTASVQDTSPLPVDHDAQSKAKQPLEAVPHNVTTHEKAPPPLGHPEQPPEQDVRLPTVHPGTTSTAPIPRFPKAEAQKHALVVLHKIWLTVAALYRRAHIFEDAREAIEEAAQAASGIERLVSANDASARALADPGWGGGGKSSDEVWADVHCARAELQHAIAMRRAEEGTPTSGGTLREVVEQYEHCLMYFPDHSGGIIGLSNILLDYYEKKIDLAKKIDDGQSLGVKASRPNRDDEIIGPTTPAREYSWNPLSTAGSAGSNEYLRKTPENLNRIAARDRAYGLLNTLTKLGSGWDNSQAWFALARAHELGGEIDRAKKILWWCIELEDTRPIRHWRNLGCSGYVL